MVHLVFSAPDARVLQQAVEGPLVQIEDDYSVGPLDWQARRDWLGDPQPMEKDTLTVHHLLQILDADPAEEVWIWMAQNAHDVCGYYWLSGRLKAYQGRIQVLYLNNLPFLNEKGAIFYPVQLSEIQPSEFRKAKRLARPITPSEFEIDPDEWTRLVAEGAGVRYLEGGKKITGKELGFYDKDILSHCTTQWQKFNRVLAVTAHRLKGRATEAFLARRLRDLVADGALEMNGDIAEVKLPA